MKKVEIILAILSVVAIAMDLLFIPGGSGLTMIFLFTLSGMYMYFSFAILNDIGLRKIFKSESYQSTSPFRVVGTVFVGFQLATTIIGILFKILNWTGADEMLSVGLVGLFIAGVVGLIRYRKSGSATYPRVFRRIIVVGGLGTILYLMPEMGWMKFKFRNYRSFIEAQKKLNADPYNQELQRKVDEEYGKIYGYDEEESH